MRDGGYRSFAIAVLVALLLIFGIGECGLGWLQLLGMKTSRHILYPATGTFYNPGPYCGFLAMLMPPALFHAVEKRDRALSWIAILYLLLSVPILPVLLGRTGWLAAAAGSLYVAFALKRLRVPRGRWLALWIAVAAAGCIFAVYLKPSSALGRLLIWRNGVAALFTNPSGVGIDNVAGALGNAQEQYFGTHDPGIFDSVAGSPEYAFNDFLQTGIAFGIAGMAIFVSVLVGAFLCAHRSRHFGVAGSIAAFAIVCFSSYPLQFREFVVAVAALIVIAMLGDSRIKMWVTVAASLLIAGSAAKIVSEMNTRRMQTEQWNKMKHIYHYRLTVDDEHRLDSLAGEMGWSANFHFDYGKALRNKAKYEKSTHILQKGLTLSSDPMFLNLIGRNFQSLEQYDSAIHYYQRSMHRLPGRLYPYYLAAKLYADSACYDRAEFKIVYAEAMNHVPKVMSPAIRDIKRELQSLNDSIDALENPR